MKRIVLFIIIFNVFFSPSIFAWEIIGILNVHEPINNAAVSHFLGIFEDNSKSLDTETKFSGQAWHRGFGTDIASGSIVNTGVSRSETFRHWLMIGGVDADVDSPNNAGEKPLRHFYDPVFTPRYLMDINGLIVNPQIDHVNWAYDNNQHHWSFLQGLQLYKAGMENLKISEFPDSIENYDGYFDSKNSEQLKAQLFAASFRALGETLHCVGDMCIPAHVRNDSHGGIGLGGDDQIEATVTHASATIILSTSNNLPDVDFLNAGKPVKEILVGCANFTNSQFYSTDSIFNANPLVTPRATPRRDYPSPNFNESDLILLDGSNTELRRIYKKISTINVILAERTLVAGFLGGKEEIYRVPDAASFGQASVLLPLAAAAGGEIIDRFLPTMKLSLEISKDQNNSTVLNGSLVHEIDKDIEWKSIGAIKYCGEGEIRVNSSTVATATFVDGIMAPVTGMSFKEKDKVQLFVMAGALIHQSNVITISTTVDTPVPTWVYAKGPEFTQLYVPSKKKTADGLDGVGVGYFETPLPATMATVLVNNFVRYDWWCDDASGTGMSNYWGGSFPEKDTIPELEAIHDYWFFSQNYASSPKELLTWTYSRELKKFCAPGGAHVLHLRAYYGPNDDSLFGKPDLQHYISLDLPFEVKAASSPITVYEYKGKDNGGYIPSEIISFSSTYPDPDSQFTGPTWAPSTWKRLKFDFDGPYTYYYKYPDLKAVGFYKKGLRSGHWTARNATNSFEIDYGSEENIIGLKIYGKDGSLEKRYSLSDTANQSSGISFSVRFMEVRGSLKNGHVETFVDPKEDYYLINSQKDGPYSFIDSNGTTIKGQYSNGNPSGIWMYHDPAKDPADWTRSY